VCEEVEYNLIRVSGLLRKSLIDNPSFTDKVEDCFDFSRTSPGTLFLIK